MPKLVGFSEHIRFGGVISCSVGVIHRVTIVHWEGVRLDGPSCAKVQLCLAFTPFPEGRGLWLPKIGFIPVDRLCLHKDK